MIVNQIDIDGVAVCEAEDDPPVPGDGHRPEPFKIAFEGVESEARDVHLAWVTCPIEQKQDARDPPNIGLRPQPRVARLVVQVQSAMAEVGDHRAR